MRDYSQEIKAILTSDLSFEEIRSLLNHYHKRDIAQILPNLSLSTRKKLYQVLPKDELSEIFLYVDDAETYFDEISNEDVADIIEEMDSNDASDTLEDLSEDKRDELLPLIEEETRNDIKLVDSYDDDLLGSQISTNYLEVFLDDTIKVAMNKIVSEADVVKNVSIIYVTNHDNVFMGTISLKDLFIARSNTSIESLLKTSYPTFYADEKIVDTIMKLNEYRLDSYPILDRENHLLGIITSADLIDITDDELNDDYYKLAGINDIEEPKERIFSSVKKRIPWLIILLFLGLIVSYVSSNFENVVKQLPIVFLFQSLVLDMSGNVGTQSLAVMIQYLTLNDSKDHKKIIFREVKIGFLNSLIIALITFVLITVFLLITKLRISTVYENNIFRVLMIACIIGFSLVVSMCVSAFFGSFVPTLFKKMKIDPAVASGPFITTINDIVSVLIYYGLAWILIIAFFR